jgi:hypothetical protein
VESINQLFLLVGTILWTWNFSEISHQVKIPFDVSVAAEVMEGETIFYVVVQYVVL